MIDNINGKACSIELYLPDSLIKTNGEYFPIEWVSRKKIKEIDGRDKSLYQGIISEKDTIKDKFHELRKAVESGKQLFILEEWNRMQILLNTIVFAFIREQSI